MMRKRKIDLKDVFRMKEKLKCLTAFMLFCIMTFNGQAQVWTQVGATIEGEAAGDGSGKSVSISADGSIIAIGAGDNDGNGSKSGHVRVFKYSSGNWTQIGADIDGEKNGNESGVPVCISGDGSTVAIGAVKNNDGGSRAGHVRVYQNISGNWVQVGNDLDGDEYNAEFGISVSLSFDGAVLAVGAWRSDGTSNGSQAGKVKIYKNLAGNWIQIGNDIGGENSGDFSGYSVALSNDGDIVAIGARGNYSNRGHVRVFQNVLNSWVQLGADIDGEALVDNSGVSVSLNSDGTIVAIGAHGNDGNGQESGHVRVYQILAGVWTQVGNDIDGEASNDRFGLSVSLSDDGSVLAAGSPYVSKNGTYSGDVRIFKNVSGVWSQIGANIPGEDASDESGRSISLSADGSVIVIGAPLGAASQRGHVRVFSTGTICSYTYSTDYQIACDSFLWDDGITYLESTSSAQRVLVNAEGCDSIITLDLVLNHSVDSTIEIIAVDSFEWKGNTYSFSGLYHYDTLSAEGCDSTVILDLTIDLSTEVKFVRNSSNIGVSVFPNPTAGLVHLTLDPDFINSKITVTNILGELIVSQNLINEQTAIIDLVGDVGVYLLSIENEQGIKQGFRIIKTSH